MSKRVFKLKEEDERTESRHCPCVRMVSFKVREDPARRLFASQTEQVKVSDENRYAC